MTTSTQTAEKHPLLNKLSLVMFWTYVSVPLAWGVSSTFQKAMALFQ
ncbi:oxalate:formate antiporter [Pseudomonas monteilii]|uniref:Oxalate:formate antiporter n=1 Tax=Pseudomonas monteilii TaxID=76759 RepID=A0A2N1IMZ3_9PSED|nr:oxalate:formate antiporter [Pseudomonas monteilii]RPD93849.1 oxalate:formate antiporter [Pseudomonas monteilii]